VSVRVVNGWSNLKTRFDRSVDGVAPWTLHDLRRTFATNLAALGTPIHVTEKLLNHVSGTVSGVAAIYNRHAYIDEMRAAISNWEKRVAEIVAPS
jgi:integrase